MKCPYQSNVLCEYVDTSGEDKNYECCDCPHYFPLPHKTDPIDGVKTIGCLLTGIILLIVMLGIAYLVINSARP
jgi:hypothetical protein